VRQAPAENPPSTVTHLLRPLTHVNNKYNAINHLVNKEELREYIMNNNLIKSMKKEKEKEI